MAIGCVSRGRSQLLARVIWCTFTRKFAWSGFHSDFLLFQDTPNIFLEPPNIFRTHTQPILDAHNIFRISPNMDLDHSLKKNCALRKRIFFSNLEYSSYDYPLPLLRCPVFRHLMPDRFLLQLVSSCDINYYWCPKQTNKHKHHPHTHHTVSSSLNYGQILMKICFSGLPDLKTSKNAFLSKSDHNFAVNSPIRYSNFFFSTPKILFWHTPKIFLTTRVGLDVCVSVVSMGVCLGGGGVWRVEGVRSKNHCGFRTQICLEYSRSSDFFFLLGHGHRKLVSDSCSWPLPSSGGF